MEEASKAKKAKKGFMTPERKKKLRVSSLCKIIKVKSLGFIQISKKKQVKKLVRDLVLIGSQKK